MRAVTFQAPGEVRIEEKPDPEIGAADDVVVRVEASGICGSDLHIYHGRVPVEPGFTIGHEFVGTVLAAGADVERVAVGDRVLGCFHTACATCAACLRSDYHRCERGRTFGHGSKLGDLQGAQAEQLLVPRANLTLRRVPEGMSDEVALFAGDVMGTGYHAVAHAGTRAGDTVAVLGLGPVGLCAVQAAVVAGAARVFAIDSVEARLAMAKRFGAVPLHLTEDDPKRAVRGATEGRGVDVVVDAVGDPGPLAMAISLARGAGTVSGIGAYAGQGEVPLGLAWLKGLTLRLGLANVIAHVDRVLGLIEAGKLDPSPLVTHHMKLDQAADAYELYDQREALKVVLTPLADRPTSFVAPCRFVKPGVSLYSDLCACEAPVNSRGRSFSSGSPGLPRALTPVPAHRRGRSRRCTARTRRSSAISSRWFRGAGSGPTIATGYSASTGVRRRSSGARQSRCAATVAAPPAGCRRRQDRPVGLFLTLEDGRWTAGICSTISPHRLWVAARHGYGVSSRAGSSCTS